MRDATQIKPTTVANPMPNDSKICQNGGVSVTMRTTIVIGDENGNIDTQNASDEFGLRITDIDPQRLNASIAITGIAICPPSCVVVTIEPITA